jgi:NAD(P)-dependent dehydrogenase (short-subunit alcohol dehydrogenase family)
MGAETLIVQTDVSLLDDVENLAQRSYAAFGAVDLLVNNAGVYVHGSVVDITMNDWNWIIGVNLYGVIHGVRTFVPHMKKQTAVSHVVNVAFTGGIRGPSHGLNGSYFLTKHAVVILTEALYYTLADEAPQVKASVYCPGYVNTELYRTDDSRPDRFNANATLMSEEGREAGRKLLQERGMSIDESAQVLFEGVQKDQLYIGPKAFQKGIHPDLADALRNRAENIINERNPDLPAA